MPERTESDKAVQIEQLLQVCEQLQAQVESLTLDSEALREQLAASESQAERLSVLVAQERWLQLDHGTQLRAADIRKIVQGGRAARDQVLVGSKWHNKYWPVPKLTINDSMEIPYPLWTLEEINQQIGAEVILPPRTEEDCLQELETDMDLTVPPPDEKPPTM